MPSLEKSQGKSRGMKHHEAVADRPNANVGSTPQTQFAKFPLSGGLTRTRVLSCLNELISTSLYKACGSLSYLLCGLNVGYCWIGFQGRWLVP